MNLGKDNPTRITDRRSLGQQRGPVLRGAGPRLRSCSRGGTEFEVLSNTIGPDGVRQLVVREVP